MKKVKNIILISLFTLNSACITAFAEPTVTVSLPQDIQTRKLIVNLAVIAIAMLSYYFSKFIMYHFGDIKNNIRQFMSKKGYRQSSSSRDNYKKKQYEIKRRQQQLNDHMQHQNLSDEALQRDMEEMQRLQNEWAMQEAIKSVTPFDMGGYVQGDGFNPSDTMAADFQRDQMNSMNDMNNMGGMF